MKRIVSLLIALVTATGIVSFTPPISEDTDRGASPIYGIAIPEIENRRSQLCAGIPIGRVLKPSDVAALAVHIMINTALTVATYDIDDGQRLVRV
ncbi:MAG TPA: hypothetical protein VHZ55_03580 [Bryobacteraceae bacterium]|jgi:hypothetical protein|nr:hypothetical protein [Bryobacteraceae bacterium]